MAQICCHMQRLPCLPPPLCAATWGKQSQGTEATEATCSLEACCVPGTESNPRALATDDRKLALGCSLPGSTDSWAWVGGLEVLSREPGSSQTLKNCRTIIPSRFHLDFPAVMLFASAWGRDSQPVGRDPSVGCISDIYSIVHNSRKITVMR